MFINNYLYANGKDTIRPNQVLLTGLFSVLMALVTSYGICSILGFFLTPLHNFIPFLLLGLGVDDMFVIVQAFKQLEPAKGCLISENFSLRPKSNTSQNRCQITVPTKHLLLRWIVLNGVIWHLFWRFKQSTPEHFLF